MSTIIFEKAEANISEIAANRIVCNGLDVISTIISIYHDPSD